jgi:hypothetical protein
MFKNEKKNKKFRLWNQRSQFIYMEHCTYMFKLLQLLTFWVKCVVKYMYFNYLRQKSHARGDRSMNSNFEVSKRANPMKY